MYEHLVFSKPLEQLTRREEKSASLAAELTRTSYGSVNPAENPVLRSEGLLFKKASRKWEFASYANCDRAGIYGEYLN